MTKFRITVAQLILNVVNLVLLFIPGFFTRGIWFEDDYFSGTYELAYEDFISFSYVTFGGDSVITFILTVLSLIAGIVFSVLWLTKQKNFNKYIQCVVSLLPAIIVFVFYFVLTESGDMTYSYTASIIYYIFVAFVFAHFALTIISIYAKLPEVPAKNKNDENEIDELKKYKELLDDGVITLEEFETKKKQLLGL